MYACVIIPLTHVCCTGDEGAEDAEGTPEEGEDEELAWGRAS